jgi:hypothetical protein
MVKRKLSFSGQDFNRFDAEMMPFTLLGSFPFWRLAWRFNKYAENKSTGMIIEKLRKNVIKNYSEMYPLVHSQNASKHKSCLS